MKKTVTVQAMIDPAKKEKAGEILSRLGLNHSWAINIFYSLIVEKGGLPFPVRLPEDVRGGDASPRAVKGSEGTPGLLEHLKKSARINRWLGEALSR